MMEELIEKLAYKEHESWNHWMKWLYQNGTWNDDGSFTITSEKAERWAGLADTPYSDLDEPTKQYDRDEVMKIIPDIKSYIEREIIGEDAHLDESEGIYSPEYHTWYDARNQLRKEQKAKLSK